MKESRAYQIEAIRQICAEWETHTNVCFQLPTGGGKTEVALDIIKSAQVQTWFIVHRKELTDQVSDILKENGIEHGIIAAGHKYQPWYKVYVCMKDTLNHLKTWPERLPELAIMDEAHHCAAKSYDIIFDTLNKCKILGLTATPRRLDNKGLNNRFTAMVSGPSILELIEAGFLAVPEISVPQKTAELFDRHRKKFGTVGGDYNKKDVLNFFDNNEKVIYGDVLDQWNKIAPGMQTLFFCPSVAKAYELADLFSQNGIPSLAIDGDLNNAERKIRIAMFKNRDITCLMSCDLIGEGFNVPDCEAIGLLRPTKSLTVYLQQVGRGLRITEKKRTVQIIDYVDNFNHFGPPWIKRHWSLDGYGTRKIRDTLTGANLKLCLKCGNYIDSSSLICKHCGNVFKSKVKAFKVIYEDLQKVTIESAQKLIERAVQKIINKERYKMLKTLDDFIAHAKFHNYSDGDPERQKEWAQKAFLEKQENDKIWKTGDRDALIRMYSKRKDIEDPIAAADDTLKKRKEWQAKNQNPVFANGTYEEILKAVQTDPKYAHIEKKEAFAKKIFNNRLAPVFAQGTEAQKAEAKELVSGAGTISPSQPALAPAQAAAAVSVPEAEKDQYTKMFEFAKSGKMNQGVLSDADAEQFARNKVLKDNKSVVDSSTDDATLRAVAIAAHVKSIDAWVAGKIEENKKKVTA